MRIILCVVAVAMRWKIFGAIRSRYAYTMKSAIVDILLVPQEALKVMILATAMG